MIDIGDRIKRRRVKLGLTQEELAARTELSKGFISQLERNLTSPSIATLEDICRALGITMAEFFTLPSEKAPALTLEQQALLARWDQLSQEQRAAFLLLMQGCSGAPDAAPSRT